MAKLVSFLDASVYSQSVCDHTAWAAQRLQASVQLMHVLGRRDVASNTTDLSGSIGLGAQTVLLEELAELDAQKARLAKKRGRALLEEAQRVVHARGVGEVSVMLRHGDIVDTVQEFEADADMIVLGKRGEGADFARLHLGSNLERVVRASHRPVLVASRSFKPIDRFVLAYDGGVSAQKAIDYIASSPLFAGLTCEILMAGQDTEAHRAQVEEACDRLRGQGLEAIGKVMPGPADEVISQRIDVGDVGLLVMGAYGHSRIRTMIIGSTTTEMLRSCKVPVLLFR